MTENQMKLHTYLKDFLDCHGFSPSMDEMRLAMGLKSKSSVHSMIVSLEKQGRITRTPKLNRTVEVVR